MTIERQWTVNEAAGIMGIKASTWRKWILLRKIRFTKLGRSVRIPEGELLRLIHEGEVPAREVRQ